MDSWKVGFKETFEVAEGRDLYKKCGIVSSIGGSMIDDAQLEENVC